MNFQKKWIAGLFMLWGLGLLAGCGGNDSVPITEDTAKQAVLDHAGLQGDLVQFTKIELEQEKGRQEYHIEFVKDGVEYDYEIDASSGEIISYDKEMDKHRGKEPVPSGDVITEAAAKEAALAHAGFQEAEVTFTKVKLDNDDGRMVYKIEFMKDGAEYDYKLDAITGEVVVYDAENAGAASAPVEPAAGNAGQMTEAAAKEAALAHAGFQEAEVAFTKVKLDNDNGRAVYEVEFVKDGMEYDYEIDAATGEVVSYDAEKK